MANRIPIEVLINAKDTASKSIKTFSDSASKMGTAVKNASIVAATGITAISAASVFLASESAKGLDIQRGFIRSFGDDYIGNIEILRQAAKGTIADTDLMLAANKAALLGITTNVDDLAGLMVTARLRGKEMGLTTTQAFDDIVTGIGRGSPLILDNLGIKIPEAVKVAMESMTEAEKTQALLNFAMQDGAVIASQLGGDTESASDKIAQLKTDFENAKSALGEKLIPVVLLAIDKFREFRGELVKQVEQVRPQLQTFVDWFAGNWQPIVVATITAVTGGLIVWAGTAAAAAISTIAAMAPVLLIVAALAIAAGFLFKAWSDNWGGIQEKTSFAVAFLMELFNGFVEFMRPIWADVAEIVALAWDVIQIRTKSAIDFFNTNVKPGLESLRQFISQNMGSIQMIITGAWSIIKNIVLIAWSAVSGGLKVGLNLLKGDWNGAWYAMKDTFAKVWYSIGQIGQGAFNIVIGSIRIGLNAIFSLINQAIRNINGQIDNLRGVTGIGDLIPDTNIPEIPALAEGGIVKARPGGTLAVIGEGGQDEAVVPLDKAGGMGTTVNVYGDVFGIDDLVRKVIDGVQKEAKANGLSTSKLLDMSL